MKASKMNKTQETRLKRMAILINPNYRYIMETLLVLPMHTRQIHEHITGEKTNKISPLHTGFRLTKLNKLGLVTGELETVIEPNHEIGEKGLAARVYNVNREVLDDTLSDFYDLIHALEV